LDNAFVVEHVEPILPGGDDVRQAVSREIRCGEMNPGSGADPGRAEIDDLLRKTSAVPLTDVVPGARVFAAVRAIPLARYHLLLTVTVDVYPHKVVVLKIEGVDGMTDPGALAPGLALFPPVKAVAVSSKR